MSKTVRIHWKKTSGSGNRSSWARVVTGIDINQPQGAQQFKGYYLKEQEDDLPIGTIILHVIPQGSVKHPYQMAELLLVTEQGLEGTKYPLLDWKEYYLSIRDNVKELLDTRQPQNVITYPLQDYTIEELEAELERRKT